MEKRTLAIVAACAAVGAVVLVSSALLNNQKRMGPAQIDLPLPGAATGKVEPGDTLHAAVLEQPELQTGIPERKGEVREDQPPVASNSSESTLAAFEAALTEGERAQLKNTGEPVEALYHYVQRQKAKLDYAGTSLACALGWKGQAISGKPDELFRRGVLNSIDPDKPLPDATKEQVLAALHQFAGAFRVNYMAARRTHGLVEQSTRFADMAIDEDKELQVWQDMDAWFARNSCEQALQYLLGQPLNGKAYLSIERFQ